MHNKQHSTWWIAILLLGCGLALIALVGQVVSARSTGPELQPPLRFAERPAALDVGTPPPGSTVVMTETFGSSFAPITDTAGTTPQWRIITNPDDTAGYDWDRSEAVPGTPAAFANSAWSAARSYPPAPALTPGVSTYPAGQDAWLIYGPIDLSKFEFAQLSFEYYLDSRAGDTLLWGYSTDGQTFYGNSQSGPLRTWITNTLSFDPDATFNAVYLAFAFNSHADPQGKGAFVSNVVLTGEPLQLNYLPIALNNYAIPTATPIPPLYGYTFDPGNNDLNLWGGTITGNPRQGYGGACVEGQFARTNHGNPVNSLALWNNCKFVPTYSSPDVDAPTDFEMVVDMSPWRLYGEDLYGVIFSADGNNLYRLSLATNVGNNVVTSILLERCAGNSCSPLTSGYSGLQPLPSGLVYAQSAFWDELRVLHIGGNIKVFINGVQVVDVTDSNPLPGHKFGVQVFPLAGNVTDPPEGAQMEIDFDNIRVYAR
jgi:hypothetical protein